MGGGCRRKGGQIVRTGEAPDSRVGHKQVPETPPPTHLIDDIVQQLEDGHGRAAVHAVPWGQEARSQSPPTALPSALAPPPSFPAPGSRRGTAAGKDGSDLGSLGGGALRGDPCPTPPAHGLQLDFHLLPPPQGHGQGRGQLSGCTPER